MLMLSLVLVLAACGNDDEPKKETLEAEETLKQDEVENDAKKDEPVVEEELEEPVKEELNMQEEAEANVEENPAGPGAMLYDKNETKFTGMNYHFKGELVKIEKMEGLFDKMQDALLVKNEQGYIMPIFRPYEVTVNAGDEIEVWGPLSGDGYASSDLGVDNVTGMTGAMNAHLINVNGKMQ